MPKANFCNRQTNKDRKYTKRIEDLERSISVLNKMIVEKKEEMEEDMAELERMTVDVKKKVEELEAMKQGSS